MTANLAFSSKLGKVLCSEGTSSLPSLGYVRNNSSNPEVFAMFPSETAHKNAQRIFLKLYFVIIWIKAASELTPSFLAS